MDSKSISTQNILLSILIAVNLVLVLVALYLFFRDDDTALNYDYDSVNDLSQTPNESPSIEVVDTPGIKGQAIAEPEQKKPNDKIKQSLDTISQSLDDTGELSSNDAIDVKALDTLNKEVDSSQNAKALIDTVTDLKAKQAIETQSLERKNEMQTIEVAEGDSLWDIALRTYGNGHDYPRIFKANPGIKDPDRIEAGMHLRIPH